MNFRRIGNGEGKAFFVCLAACLASTLLSVCWTPPAARAEPSVSVSPVHAGCYLARADRCKIHVEPFVIQVASGRKLVQFQLVATPSGGSPRVIYDFRLDASNPLPYSGTTVAPSRVAKDFGARCGHTYTLMLTGRDTGDAVVYSLGQTAAFTCPVGTFKEYLPLSRK